jgi:hypothetical protein
VALYLHQWSVHADWARRPAEGDGDKAFDDVFNELHSGQKTDAANTITAEAANITKLLCSTTGGQPEAACK